MSLNRCFFRLRTWRKKNYQFYKCVIIFYFIRKTLYRLEKKLITIWLYKTWVFLSDEKYIGFIFVNFWVTSATRVQNTTNTPLILPVLSWVPLRTVFWSQWFIVVITLYVSNFPRTTVAYFETSVYEIIFRQSRNFVTDNDDKYQENVVYYV